MKSIIKYYKKLYILFPAIAIIAIINVLIDKGSDAQIIGFGLTAGGFAIASALIKSDIDKL